MDESYLLTVTWVTVLLILDALVSVTYTAVTTNEHRHANEDDNTRISPRSALAGHMSMLLLRFSAAVLVIDGLSTPLAAQFPAVPAPVFHALFLLPLAILTLSIGDHIPTIIGTHYAESLGENLAPLMRALAIVLRPFLAIVHLLNTALLRLFSVQGEPINAAEEQILAIVDSDENMEAEERKMIQSVLQLDDTTVSEMMIPRMDITAVEQNTTIADARSVFLDSGHSRLPVYEENIDHVIGVVYVKDLLEVWHNGHTTVQSVAEILRPAHFVTETMTADNLLRFFQREKVHLAIALDEYGGTAGLVTLENLLEEIVGDIQDEYDEDEPQEIVKLSDNEYCFDAGITLDDLNDELDTELDEDEVDTLGGYIFSQLERVPAIGEVIEADGLQLTVRKVEGRRIREVHVRKLDPNTKPIALTASTDASHANNTNTANNPNTKTA